MSGYVGVELVTDSTHPVAAAFSAGRLRSSVAVAPPIGRRRKPRQGGEKADTTPTGDIVVRGQKDPEIGPDSTNDTIILPGGSCKGNDCLKPGGGAPEEEEEHDHNPPDDDEDIVAYCNGLEEDLEKHNRSLTMAVIAWSDCRAGDPTYGENCVAELAAANEADTQQQRAVDRMCKYCAHVASRELECQKTEFGGELLM